MKYTKFTFLTVLLAVFCYVVLYAQQQQKSRPNLMVILIDDVGYSDIGCFGSEIATPNLDKLAQGGVKMTQFYNNARCCPTRATLLTGLYPHDAGIGWMTGTDMGLPGYIGELNQNCVTMAQVLKPAGYNTYATGKWHVSSNGNNFEGPKYNWPLQRGFDHYFGIVPGAASYFAPKFLTSSNQRIYPGKNFYLTDAIADTTAKYIHDQASKKDPFFMYVAFTAAHWPLQAKPQDIKKYENKYLVGWDAIRKARYEKQQSSGLLDKSVKFNGRDSEVPAWADVPEADKARWAKRMAIYAAQIDCMDQGVGRIVKALKETGQYDNTLIIFLSDNGACAEMIDRTKSPIEELGTGKSFESYRINWANASNTPFKLYKHWVHEGGISAPCIVSWPNKLAHPGSVISTPSHIIDVAPTLFALAGAKYPANFDGKAIHPLPGRSMVPILTGQTVPDRTIFWEHEANRAVRTNEWKLVSKGDKEPPYTTPWELYNMKTDRAETNNLAAKYPDRVKEMAAEWDKWAAAHNVLPISGLPGGKRKDVKGGKAGHED